MGTEMCYLTAWTTVAIQIIHKPAVTKYSKMKNESTLVRARIKGSFTTILGETSTNCSFATIIWDLYSGDGNCARTEVVTHWWAPSRLTDLGQRDPPWLWNPWQTAPEVQNRGISDPTKKGPVSSKIKKNWVSRSLGQGQHQMSKISYFSQILLFMFVFL